MKCANCNREVESDSRFCRNCGSPINSNQSDPLQEEKYCTKCGKKISIDARFCNYCGEKNTIPTEDTNEKEGDIDLLSNYVTWRILPGQIALKIDEAEINAYKTVKGIYIMPGTKALFFVDGEYAACLDSGKYAFKNTKGIIPKNQGDNPVVRFFKNVAEYVSNGLASLFGSRHRASKKTSNSAVLKSFYTVVLVRKVEFPLIFDFKDVNTKGIRSDIGLHIVCKITNLNSFFESELVDSKMVVIKSLSDSLYTAFNLFINEVASEYSPDEIDNNAELLKYALESLNEKVQSIYSYLSVTSILNLTSKRAELEDLRVKREKLYVDELNLKHLQEKNDFINRLQSVEHSQELAVAREYVDFRSLMDKIDEDGMLNESKREQYAYMLKAHSELARATTDNDKTIAINKLQQTALLSDEEIDALKREIKQRSNLKTVANEHALSMAIIQNKIDEDKEALRWETEIGNQLLANELKKERMSAEFFDERRDANFEFEKKKMSNKMDLLRQAQELREEREKAQHSRNMEMQKAQNEHDLEKYKITASMTFEQIMASNPDITPEAAQAFAKKFESEATANNSDRNSELQRMHNEDLKEILARQFALTESVISAQKQSSENTLLEKQSELDRVHLDSERNQDRFLSGMQTTIESISATIKPRTANKVFCPQCGKAHNTGTLFCDNCGATI